METSLDYVARRSRVRRLLQQYGPDVLVVGPTSNMQYLLGYVPHPDERPCLYLLTPEGEAYLVPDVNAADVRAHVALKLDTYLDEEGPVRALKAALRRAGVKSAASVGLDGAMRTDFALMVLEELAQASAGTVGGVLDPMRMVKEDAEITLVRANAASADEAMKSVFSSLEPGMREDEVGSVAREAFGRSGASSVDFTIIGSGPNGAFPHHATGSRELAVGDAVVIDIGAGMDGYHSDITRMAVLGTLPEGYEEVHGIVERAVDAALSAARPGVRARDVDAAARQVIVDAGYGDFFPHRTGHGLGLDGHEPPFLTRTSETILQAGMVFSIEPGIYLPGRFGVRLEEIVVLETNGPAVLSTLGREPFLVPTV